MIQNIEIFSWVPYFHYIDNSCYMYVQSYVFLNIYLNIFPGLSQFHAIRHTELKIHFFALFQIL